MTLISLNSEMKMASTQT